MPTILWVFQEALKVHICFPATKDKWKVINEQQVCFNTFNMNLDVTYNYISLMSINNHIHYLYILLYKETKECS